MPYSAVQKDFYLFPVNGVYYVQFRDPTSRRLLSKKSTGLRNGTMADKWAKKEYDRLCAEIGKVTDITFGEYASHFFIDGCPHEKERKSNGKTFGNGTRRNYRCFLEHHILPDIICNKRLCDITRPDSINLRDRLIDQLGYTRKAEQTLLIYRLILHQALNRGLINSDPTAKVYIKGKTKKRSATNVEGIKSILLKKYWPNKTLWLAAMTAAIVGLRASEICGLMWKHVDKEKEKIYIVQAYVKTEGLKSTKSGNSRKAPYPGVLQELLEPHRKNPNDFVFSLHDGKPLDYSALRSAMKRTMERVVKDAIKKKKTEAGDLLEVTKEENKNGIEGITSITLHGLRHSINTALLDEGVNPETLRASFGWQDVETQEIYTHRDLYDLTPQREAVDRLFEGFKGEE